MMIKNSQKLLELASLLERQQSEISHLRDLVESVLSSLGVERLSDANEHFRRNYLPNDSLAVQRMLQLSWRMQRSQVLNHDDLLESGFRIFSQGDEDGIILRIFSQIGTTNKIVVEIGSNCDNSDLGFPENLSSNLIVNHCWAGYVFELDKDECKKIRHFFARDASTKHFHSDKHTDGYFSPIITEGEVNPENASDLMSTIVKCENPDLFVLDIDGGDFAVMESLSTFRPRVIVVEFEKVFRDRHSVVQRRRNDFSKLFSQSGTVSLSAWIKLMEVRGYVLTCISASGFNAFFVRADVANDKINTASASQVFDSHPILANSELIWREPDDSWEQY